MIGLLLLGDLNGEAGSGLLKGQPLNLGLGFAGLLVPLVRTLLIIAYLL
jgi:hypothetical protein